MNTFETILFATDFSENSEKAFDYALSMAKAYNARLLILHVSNEPVDLRGFYVPHISFETLEKEIEEGAEKMMEKFCQSRLAGFSNVETKVTSGIPADEIVMRAEEAKASLIVLGTQGRTGLDHFLFGSTAERVVRTARCAVLTVRLPASSV
jgi:nucleotide-binding universal stress UspA family protein